MFDKLVSYLVPPFDSRGFIMWAIGLVSISVVLVFLHRRSNISVNQKLIRSGSSRNDFIDFLRGWAITFVAFYHWMYNLSIAGFVPKMPFFNRSTIIGETVEFWLYFLVTFMILTEILYYSVHVGYVWFAFITAVCIPWHYAASQVSGVGIMLITMGMASYVQNHDGIKWRKVLRRTAHLALISALISIVTYFVIPREWIYFGAIHCIAVLSVVHLPFIVYPQLSIVGTILIILHYVYYSRNFILDFPRWRVTADYMPWFANLAYVLLGVFLAHKGLHKATHLPRCLWGGFRPGIRWQDTIFPYLGRHSLFIFIAHQVVLFPLIKILALFF
jgi:uncharacterized membrane protein